MASRPSFLFHWLGGTPREIKIDKNGDIAPEEMNEQARGWLLYLEEQWVPHSVAHVPVMTQNTRLDMILPITATLQGAKEREEFPSEFQSVPDTWDKDIEQYAPGYLEMERNGMEGDYDLRRLVNPRDIISQGQSLGFEGFMKAHGLRYEPG
ncbi:hypothetical protein BDV06DRAFT_219168 [Aspergillus oleicola]